MDAALGIFSGLMIGMVILGLVVAALIILTIIFWIYMLIDAIQRKYHSENDKVVWILVIIFVGIIGAIIYYFVVKTKDKKIKIQK
jgi:hypothetical protein